MTKPKEWSERDDATIRRFYATMETSLLATRMGRSQRSIGERAHKLGIRKEERSKPMVAPSIKQLKANKDRARRYLHSGHTP